MLEFDRKTVVNIIALLTAMQFLCEAFDPCITCKIVSAIKVLKDAI